MGVLILTSESCGLSAGKDAALGDGKITMTIGANYNLPFLGRNHFNDTTLRTPTFHLIHITLKVLELLYGRPEDWDATMCQGVVCRI